VNILKVYKYGIFGQVAFKNARAFFFSSEKRQCMQHLSVKINKQNIKDKYGGTALGCQIAGPGLETPFPP
jgi:hypothetical protein